MIRRSGKCAFTLIELLIVVAIIGILAAIAVPNFLNAKIRATISRSMSDIRSISTALATYRLDNNCVPFRYPGWPASNSSMTHTYNLAPLTAPVSYITSIPFDPFCQVAGVKTGADRGDGLPVGWYLYVGEKTGLEPDAYHGMWWIWGWGPDKTRQSYPFRPLFRIEWPHFPRGYHFFGKTRVSR